jgi:hypothetical protein
MTAPSKLWNRINGVMVSILALSGLDLWVQADQTKDLWVQADQTKDYYIGIFSSKHLH